MTTKPSQKRAVTNNRRRLKGKGMARFEVRALEKDKTLLREVAARLAEAGPSADRLRKDIRQKVLSNKGSGADLLAAMRTLPGGLDDVDLTRRVTYGRDIDL